MSQVCHSNYPRYQYGTKVINSFLLLLQMKQFCYWDSKSQGDAIIIMIMMVFSFGIGCFTTVRLRRNKILAKRGKKIIIIYLLVFAWCFLFTSQFVYSIIIYYTQIRGKENVSVDSYSRNYIRFDILPGFIVQTIFLIICRFYYKGIMNAIEVSRLQKWQRRYINYLDYYLIVRFVLQFIGVMLVNIYADTDQIPLFSQINIWILMLDSVITNIFLGLSLKIYLKATKFIYNIDKQDLATLKVQYSLMIVTSLMRIVIDIPFLIMPIFMRSNNDSCLGDFNSHIIQAIIYNIIGNLINHFIPIIWVLKIYNFETVPAPSIKSSSNSNDQFINSQTRDQ